MWKRGWLIGFTSLCGLQMDICFGVISTCKCIKCVSVVLTWCVMLIWAVFMTCQVATSVTYYFLWLSFNYCKIVYVGWWWIVWATLNQMFSVVGELGRKKVNPVQLNWFGEETPKKLWHIYMQTHLHSHIRWKFVVNSWK